MKEGLTLAFHGIGGARKLQLWANENLTEFYKLWAKMLPVEAQHSGPEGEPLIIRIMRDPE